MESNFRRQAEQQAQAQAWQKYHEDQARQQQEAARIAELERELSELKMQGELEEARVDALMKQREVKRVERRQKREERKVKLRDEIAVMEQEVAIARAQKDIAKQQKLMDDIKKMEMGMKALDREIDITPPAWGSSWGKTYNAQVNTFTLDTSDYSVSALPKTRAKIEVKAKPFDKGAFRFAFYGQEGSRRMVMKQLIYSRTPELDFDDHKENVRLHLISNYFCEQFNKAKPSSAPAVSYCTASIYEFEFEGQPVVMFGEDLLPAKFEKYNNNVEYVNTDHQLPQTYSHFTYQFSGSNILVCDVQGCFHGGKYLFTDPACHRIGTEGKEFGDANHGKKGVDNFFRAHTCNEHCRAMGLRR